MKKFCVYFSLAVLVMFLGNISSLHAQSKDPIVVMTEYTVNEANMDKVIDILSEIQKKTLENEEGCVVYEILLDDKDTSKIFVYENYESEAAYKKHTTSAHFKNNAPKLKSLVKTSAEKKLIPINQEQYSDEEV